MSVVFSFLEFFRRYSNGPSLENLFRIYSEGIKGEENINNLFSEEFYCLFQTKKGLLLRSLPIVVSGP